MTYGRDDLSTSNAQAETGANGPLTPKRSTKGLATYSNAVSSPDVTPLALPTASTGRRHRKPPPPLDLTLEIQPSPFKQLLQLPATQLTSESTPLHNVHEGLTDIIDSLEEEIGNMMGTPERTQTFHSSDLRLVSAEPTDPLNFRKPNVIPEVNVHSKLRVSNELAIDNQNARFPSQGLIKTNAYVREMPGLPEELRTQFSYSLPERRTPSTTDNLPLLLSPSKDIIQGPLLPAYGIGRRSMVTSKEPIDSISPASGLGYANPDVASPLKSNISADSKLPISGDFEFAAENDEYSLSDDLESMHTLEQQLWPADTHSLSTQSNSITASRDSLGAQNLESLRPALLMRSQESGTGSNSRSALPAFFVPEKIGDSTNGSRSNLDLILENADGPEPPNHSNFGPLNSVTGTNATRASMSQNVQASPGYPLAENIDMLLGYTFGHSSPQNPRSPLKPTPTFMSTESGMSGVSGVSRTWSNSALLKNFHQRMLLASSITSNLSNRPVNLATLKRSFSLRPGEGEQSAYVQTIRKRVGTSYNETGPGRWKLPTGIMPVDKKSLYLQISNKYNRGGNSARGKKASGVELKHGHLRPRMLAAEVDDSDDSNRFGSLGRSISNAVTSSTTPKGITPVTSKSSNSILGGISRESSLNRSKSLASGSTNNDIQSVRTRDSKVSRIDSDASSSNSDGSISEYKFLDGYYQHPRYKYDDEADSERFSPSTEDGTMNANYDDIDDINEDYDDEEEKPRLFLANPDLSSEEWN